MTCTPLLKARLNRSAEGYLTSPILSRPGAAALVRPQHPSLEERSTQSLAASTQRASHLSTHEDEVCVSPQPVQEDLDGEQQPFVAHDLQLLLKGTLVPAGFAA